MPVRVRVYDWVAVRGSRITMTHQTNPTIMCYFSESSAFLRIQLLALYVAWLCAQDQQTHCV